MSLARFSIRQSVLVNLLYVLVVLAGVGVASRIPLDVFPDISFNHAVIVTLWPGASPEEVERLITQPIEDEIEDVHGIKEMFSFSHPGVSEIHVEWDETLSEAEHQAALDELRAAIDRVTDLPADAERPVLRELSVSEVYHICIVAVSDVGGVGELALRRVARDLDDRLDELPGVRKTVPQGMRDRELRVYVDPDLARRYDLTLPEIAAAIARNNENIPAGSITDAEGHEITLRGVGDFASPEALAAMVIRKSPTGQHVRLGRIARVVPALEKRRFYGRYLGKPSIMIGIAKEADADAIDVIDGVRAFLRDYAKELPDGVVARVTWDMSKYVRSRLAIMRSNLELGVVAVVLVLWFTVGFRNALLAIVGVPFSFLCALIFFPLLGLTINSISLVGFIMVSGMLVDHAIIILENIYRHIEEGKGFREAIVEGTDQVMWPVVSTVATTVAAFLPLLLVSGTSGEFMAILPKTVILTLAASLAEALVILPAHYLDWGSRQPSEDLRDSPRGGIIGRLSRWSHGLRRRVDRATAALRERYLWAQQRLLAHRFALLAVCGASLYFAWGVYRHVPVDLFPSDFNNLFVTIQTPREYGLDRTDKAARHLEEVLASLGDEIIDYDLYVGVGMTADMVPVRGPNYAVAFVTFPDTAENLKDPYRMVRRVRARVEAMRRAHPGEIENLLVFPPRNGPPVGKPVAIRVQGDDYRQVKEVANRVRSELATLPGVYNIEDNLPLGPRELRLVLDEERASLYGLSFRDVGLAFRAASDGLVLSTFKDPRSDEDVDIRVMFPEERRRRIADLLDAEVRTPTGARVRIGDVARVEMGESFRWLYRYNGRRTAVVYADVDGHQATSVSVNREMQSRFRDVGERYPGVHLIFGGEFERTREAFRDMGKALGIALLAIYAILAAQFRSYLQPLVVMSVVGLAFVGVVVSAWVLGFALSMYVLYAVVGLAGVVVNDSLVLMDFVNQERRAGASAVEAVRLASRHRFRPILLTTLTTVAGLLPMALGLSGHSRVFAPFATAFVAGLAISSGLTLFVVPALYLVLEDARSALVRRRRGVRAVAPERLRPPTAGRG